MYALFEEAGKFLAGRVMTEAENSAQIELESGKRVKVKAASVLLKFEQPTPTALIASATSAREGDRPRPRLGVRAGQRVRLRRPGARLLRTGRRREAGRRAVPPVRGAALLPPPRQGQLQEGARRDRQGRPARHRTQEAARCADRRLGRRPGRRRLPGAGARAAVPDPLQAGPQRARIQGSGRGGEPHLRPPLDLLKAAGAIDSPYQFHWRRFLFEQFPKGTGFRRCGAHGQGHAAARAGRRPSRSTIRRRPRSTMRCRCRASAAAGHARHPHRRTGTRLHAGLGRRPRRPRTPVDGLHAGLEGHDAARRDRRGLHADRRPPMPRRLAVRDLRRSDAGGRASATRLERVAIAANLRHDQLDSVITEATLAGGRRPATVRARARVRVPAGAPPEGAARAGARQAGDVQPAGLRLPSRPATATNARRRAGVDRAAPARLGTRPDRRRGDDPDQQHLGPLACRLRRARHLPQPGQPRARA